MVNIYLINKFISLYEISVFIVISKVDCNRSRFVRLISEIAGSNPAEGMDVRLLCLLCAVYVVASAKTQSLIQKSPTVCVCVCVCMCVCV